MPIFNAHNISFQFENGETLFQQISCSMTSQRIGLVGRNGAGKSILATILIGELAPSNGTISLPDSVAIYRQQHSEFLFGDQTVVQYLGKASVLEALEKIEAGECASEWFDAVGEEWELRSQLLHITQELGLPKDPYFPCAKLSGGQMALLQLWKLFRDEQGLLILDEPSNHLDASSKNWLRNRILTYKGSILLISHDRELLNNMEEIWELSSLGVQVFGGNYNFYFEQKSKALQATERQLSNAIRQKKQIAEQAQRNKEKAEQRAAKSSKIRKSGSQPKSMLDFFKGKAGASLSSRKKSEQIQRDHNQQKILELSTQREALKTQKLYLSDAQSHSKKAFTLSEAVLPFGSSQPMSLSIFVDDRVHLNGSNGSGKSTLLKMLLGHQRLQSGELKVNSPLYYLDQHCSVIQNEQSVLETLMHRCPGMNESDARTLLAGIGFRGDRVFRPTNKLSGGEKIKLAMLVVSHQPERPFLLLDEPDNHLDIDSKQMLGNVLNAYRGGFILVSHDRTFVSDVGITTQLNLI